MTSFLPGTVLSSQPRSQVKYFTSADRASESMARLLVPLNEVQKEQFLASLKKEIILPSNSAGLDESVLVNQLVGNSGYIDFLLESVDEQLNEKVQNVQFLGDDYTSYFFGQAPPQFNFTGTLFTTYQDDWWTSFYLLYRDVLRGSQLSKHQQVVTLRYDSRLITGSLLNFSARLQANQQMAVNVAFSMLVKEIDIVPPLNALVGASFVPDAPANLDQIPDDVLKRITGPTTINNFTQTSVVGTPRSSTQTQVQPTNTIANLDFASVGQNLSQQQSQNNSTKFYPPLAF